MILKKKRKKKIIKVHDTNQEISYIYQKILLLVESNQHSQWKTIVCHFYLFKHNKNLYNIDPADQDFSHTEQPQEVEDYHSLSHRQQYHQMASKANPLS